MGGYFFISAKNHIFDQIPLIIGDVFHSLSSFIIASHSDVFYNDYDYILKGEFKMTFGNWPEYLHRNATQVGNRERAAKVNLIAIDPIACTAQAEGSDGHIYEVSLDHCTCGSFLSSHKPCKHMYRLALDLNLIDDLPKTNRDAAKAFKKTIPDEIKRYEDLYFNGAISTSQYVAIVKALSK